MSSRPLTILQVNQHEMLGGAECVAVNLFQSYRQRGLNSYLAVGRKATDDPGVLAVSTGQGRGRWYRIWRKLADKFGGPARVIDELQGIECFRYPATYLLPGLAPHPPDIVHAHNLHGGYFDLRALPWLSRRMPLVLTLHDAWLLSGHCAQAFDCERWKTGCGHCPDLTIYPAIRRDATAYNWERKRAIYAQSRLHVATPSSWLMRKVEQSMLAPGIVDARVIPNGVDLAVFKPVDRHAVREELDIPQDIHVLLFVASDVRQNLFKDYRQLRSAAAMVAEEAGGSDVLFVVLGESAGPERIGRTQIRFVAFEPDPTRVAKYYQAADLYLYAARADTFPTTIIEALACGTPVVATAVGGIPEQVKSFYPAPEGGHWRAHATDTATGVLTVPGDANGMAQAASTLLNQPILRQQIGHNASRDVQLRFNLDQQRDAYLDWYYHILEQWHGNLSRIRS